MSENDDTEKEETVAVTKEQGAQITSEAASGGPEDFHHSMPRFGDGYGNDDDRETLNMECEMRKFKAEEIRLKRDIQKESLKRQVEAQREKVLNLSCMNRVSVSEKVDGG